MANTKKTSVTEEVAKDEVIKETPKKTPRKFAQDEMIPCRSVTYGELLYPAKKSQLLYTWANYGDVTEVEFQDLQALRSTRSQYLNDPKFIIEDDELLEQWPEFKKLYENVALIDTDKLFALPLNQFKAKLRNIPAGFRDSLKNVASAKILDGTLDSLAKINAMDEILGTDLKLLIQ